MKKKIIIVFLISMFLVCFNKVSAKVKLDDIVSRDDLINELTQNPNKYLGTTYVGATTTSEFSDVANPGVGMNCAGFILAAIRSAKDDSTYVVPEVSGALNTYNRGLWATDWLNYVESATGSEQIVNSKYTSLTGWPDITSLLSNAKLRKGDIIVFVPKVYDASTCDYHIGFYWGSSDGEDKFWHSMEDENMQSKIQGKNECTYQFVALKFQEKGSIGIEKKSDLGTPLSDIKFELYSDNSLTNLVASKTTGADGKAVFDNLLIGNKYYLKEVNTASGYVLLSNSIEVSPTRTLQYKTITNTLTTTEIKKTDATTGKEVEGAELRILDKDKKEIACIIKNGTENTKVEKCSWKSGKEATTVLGLTAGEKYYLEETLAPNGYEKTTSLQEFTIKTDGTTTKVEMKNKLKEVPVPDTLGKRSILLISIGMLDLALGIGIIIYVKKKKIKV